MQPQVLLETKNNIAYLTLNRNEANNSLTPSFLREILAALNLIAEEGEANVVLLSAKSTFFSIGGDMNYFQSHQKNPKPAAEEIVGCLNEMIMAMIALPIPIVSAVHSVVTGGSLAFLLASDLVIASPETQIKAHYSSAGFSPDGGWATLLPLLTNQRKAAEFIMLNNTCTAEEAERIGLVNCIVEPDQVFAKAQKWADKIAQSPKGTIQKTKKLLWGDLDRIKELLDAEYNGFIELSQTEEARHGIARFLSQFTHYHSIEASRLT